MISARELFAAGHYAGVVAVCTEGLDLQPTDTGLLFERARAWVALRRLDQAQSDLRELLRLDPRSGPAYRTLGQLLARGGKLAAAREAFRRALQLDDADPVAREQFFEVEARLAARTLRERIAAERIVGRDPRGRRLATALQPEAAPEPVRDEGLAITRRIVLAEPATATDGPEDASPEGPVGAARRPANRPSRRLPLRASTAPMTHVAGRGKLPGSATSGAGEPPSAGPGRRAVTAPLLRAEPGAPVEIRAGESTRPMALAASASPHGRAATGSREGRAATAPLFGRAATTPGVSPAHGRAKTTPSHGHSTRAASTASERDVVERDSFADYLVRAGVLTVERLRAALTYQRATGVTLATAVVALGLASPQRMESAAVAHRRDTTLLA